MKTYQNWMCRILILLMATTGLTVRAEENDAQTTEPTGEIVESIDPAAEGVSEEPADSFDEEEVQKETETSEVEQESIEEIDDLTQETATPVEVNVEEPIPSEETIDLQETQFHAVKRLNRLQTDGIENEVLDSYQLVSKGRVACHDPLMNSGYKYEYITLFEFDGQPAYCIEPTVLANTPNGFGVYTATSGNTAWLEMSEEDKLLCKRYTWYGYQSGAFEGSESFEAYIATQLLIWEVADYQSYQIAYSSLKVADEPTKAYKAFNNDPSTVYSYMEIIRNLTANHDTAPSFANTDHTVKHYELEWDETLVLEDTNGVLNWFNEDSEESHKGIHVKQEENKLYVDIDDLYYEGYETNEGKTLTFQRTTEQWDEMRGGILLYTSGSLQKLMGAKGIDPTPQYQLSFSLKRANIQLNKLNEYLEKGAYTNGTSFYIGWYEDPKTQYETDGLQDTHWPDLIPSYNKKDDLYGNSNVEDLSGFYYPILTEDGSQTRIFTVGSDSILSIENLLPCNKKWWMKEVDSADALVKDQNAFLVTTGNQNTTESIDFVNALRDVTLEVVKQDEENNEEKINEAHFVIYETGNIDLSKEDTQLGYLDTASQTIPRITYQQMKDHDAWNVQDSFTFLGYRYEIVEETDQQYVLSASLVPTDQTETDFLSRYQLPVDYDVATTFTVPYTTKKHATDTTEDDEIEMREMVIEEIQETGESTVVIVKEKNVKDNIFVTADTKPSYEDFKNTAARQNLSFTRDTVLAVNGKSYLLKSVSTDNLIASPMNRYEIDMDDATPVASDLENYHDLKVNDSFTLSYPKDHQNYETTEFTVQSVSDREIILLNQQTEYSVSLPTWMEYEDIPETVNQIESFRVTDINAPIYTVKDSRGNVYSVSENGTDILVNSELAKTSDLSYEELTHTKPDTGSYCEEPFSVSSCPVLLERTKEILYEDRIVYEGIPYAKLENVQAQEEVSYEGVVYTVLNADEDTVLLSYVNNQKEYVAEISAAEEPFYAVHTYTIPVTFTIEDKTEKEITVDWETIQPGKNSLTNQSSLHLYPYAEEATQGDLNYAMVEGDSFLDANGIAYTVLYHDSLNHKAVVESYKGRYELTDSETKSVMPITYRQFVRQEEGRNAAFIVGDIVQNDFPNILKEKESFYVQDDSYVLVSDAWSNERGTNTLTNTDCFIKKIFYAWNTDAPVPGEVLLKETSPFIYEGKEYCLKTVQGNQEVIYQLTQTDTGTIYTYLLEDITDSTSVPFDRKDAQPITFTVNKPAEVTYEELQNAAMGEKRAGNHVMLNEILLKIKLLSREEIELEEETTGKIYALREESIFLPFTKDEFDEAPMELLAGDSFAINNADYRIESIGQKESFGEVYTLKNESTGAIFEVCQYPDAYVYETETITVYPTENAVSLSLKYNASCIELLKENPHIRLTETNDGFEILSDAISTATLCYKNREGTILEKEKIAFSNHRESQTYTGIPVFAGYTGHQYLRLVNAGDHNMPLAGYTVAILQDGKNVTTLVSDSYGAIDVSDLDVGTYTYVHPFTHEEQTFSVVNPEERTGQLCVDRLKWGRTYVAYEDALPEGYDYGNTEAIHTFTMNVEEGNHSLLTSIENRLRRLSLRVFKTDATSRKTLLNNAYFQVDDVTEAETMTDSTSSFASKVTLSDIPTNAKVGDNIPIWRAKENGATDTYRVEKVLADQVVVSKMVNGKFSEWHYVPVNGYSTTAGMLYSDITKSLSLIQNGAYFKVTEKEDIENLKTYKILSLQREEGTDIFNQTCTTQRITEALVIETNVQNAQPIMVGIQTAETTEGIQNLGVFLSGGIAVKRTEETPVLPISWEMVKDKYVGDEVNVSLTVNRTIPDYETLLRAVAINQKELCYETETWNIEESNEAAFTLSTHGITVFVDEKTQGGSIRYKEVRKATVQEVIKEEGVTKAVRLQDENGSSWYCTQDLSASVKEEGIAGVETSIAKAESPDIVLARAYTDENGIVKYKDLENGDYLLSVNDETTNVHVEEGMITLPEVKYGHTLRICELESPLGYIVGNACSVITPKAEYTVNTVENYRPNEKLITKITRLRKIVQKRKMGGEV